MRETEGGKVSITGNLNRKSPPSARPTPPYPLPLPLPVGLRSAILKRPGRKVTRSVQEDEGNVINAPGVEVGKGGTEVVGPYALPPHPSSASLLVFWEGLAFCLV